MVKDLALLRATKMAAAEDDSPPLLLPCTICCRTFKPDSLAKHAKACEKNATKKRKVFDSSKQRIQGTDLAEFLPIILHNKKNEKAPEKKPVSKWKEKHLEFVRAIRAARGAGDEATKSTAAPSRPSNHEKCPHCDRNFGPKAFDRHIEWCREQKARIPKSPASQQAKERLEARTKYRAPPLAKSKRTLTREKYSRISQSPAHDLSPMGSRSANSLSQASQASQESKSTTSTKAPSVRSRAKGSTSSPSCTVQRANSQIRRRETSASPCKRPVNSGSKNNAIKATPVNAKSNDVPERENLFSSSCNITKIQPGGEGQFIKGVKPVAPQNRTKFPRVQRRKSAYRTSNITLVLKTSVDAKKEKYDPYVSAERQMQELLSHGDGVQVLPTKHAPATTQPQTNLPAFESSPRSAFVKYSPKGSVNSSLETTVPSSIIAEFEDLFISGSSKQYLHPSSNVGGEDSNQNMQNTISLVFPVSNNNAETIQQPRKTSKIRAKMESASLSLQQSVSLLNYENSQSTTRQRTDSNIFIESEKPRIVQSLFQDFSVYTAPGTETSSFLPPKNSSKDCSSTRNTIKDGNLIRSSATLPADAHPQGRSNSLSGKISLDSAYGSLNRHTPIGAQTNERNESGVIESERSCLISSSSSESSLPPLCTVQVVKREASSCSLTPTPPPVADSSHQPTVPRMSKFCHECGSKYPVSVAKFCCECGVRRLAM